MVISQNGAGHLQIHMDWPSPLKNKGVFFVKRYLEPLPEVAEEELSDHLACGDIHPNVLGTHYTINVFKRHTVTFRSFLCLG